MSKKIKTVCPGCEKEFILDVPAGQDMDDEVISGMTLKLAAMVHCKACSVYRESRDKLEKVRRSNNQTIWEQEDRLKRAKKNSDAALEIKENIRIARADLLDAVKQIGRLDDARAAQGEEFDYVEEI